MIKVKVNTKVNTDIATIDNIRTIIANPI